MLPKPKQTLPLPNDPQRIIHTQTTANEILQLTETPNLEDIPSLCHKAIASIITKANRKLTDSLRKKEDNLYKKSPKRYHNNLKTASGLQPNVKDQPNLESVRDPTTNEITTQPTRIVHIVQQHFEKEHSRITPDHIPIPPWQDPLNPDTYTNPKPTTTTTQHTLDHFITTRLHATERPLARPRARMQSQMRSSNTFPKRHTI